MVGRELTAGLLAWSLLSMGSAIVGLHRRPGEYWRAFWFMSGLWGLIDGAIAWYTLLGDWPDPATLVNILRVNAGLDLLYIAAGVALLTRVGPRPRGFGLAVLIQGLFLFLLDGHFWWRCVTLPGI